MRYTVSLIVIEVFHAKFKKTHHLSNSGRFTTRVSDAKRFTKPEYAAPVVKSLTSVWKEDGYSFKVSKLNDPG